jgi:hypothetical protein
MRSGAVLLVPSPQETVHFNLVATTMRSGAVAIRLDSVAASGPPGRGIKSAVVRLAPVAASPPGGHGKHARGFTREASRLVAPVTGGGANRLDDLSALEAAEPLSLTNTGEVQFITKLTPVRDGDDRGRMKNLDSEASGA